MKPDFGFRELAHTADWELEVWAPGLPTLLEQAARGMYALAGMKLLPDPRQVHTIILQAEDAEGLLVRFLSELLWLQQEQEIGFDEFDIHIDQPFNLKASLKGSVIAKLDKEIKAVTYHNLAVQTTSTGLHVNIVFDV